ncbi:MAG: hypothetical protein RPT11_02545, partial [Bermanella sp.]
MARACCRDRELNQYRSRFNLCEVLNINVNDKGLLAQGNRIKIKVVPLRFPASLKWCYFSFRPPLIHP